MSFATNTSAPPVAMPQAAPQAGPPHLSAEHLAQLQRAEQSMRKLRRVVLAARIDGWSVGVFGGLTVLLGLFDWQSLLLGGVMVGVAIVELRAAERLKRLDGSVTRTLGWNQIVFGGALMTYAILRLLAVSGGESAYASMIAQEPELANVLGPMEDLTRQIMLAVYACLIAVAVFAQGGLALYYFTRRRIVRDYLATTPAWIVEMQRAGVMI